MLQVPFAESVEASPRWETDVDLEAWRADGYTRPLSSYRLPERATFATTMDPEKKAQLLVRVRTFGEHAQGLGKFTRTMFARDLRRVLVHTHEPRELAVASGV